MGIAWAQETRYVRIATGPVESVLLRAGYAPHGEAAGWRIPIGGGAREAASINRTLVEAGCGVSELSIRRGTLESFYLHSQRKAA